MDTAKKILPWILILSGALFVFKLVLPYIMPSAPVEPIYADGGVSEFANDPANPPGGPAIKLVQTLPGDTTAVITWFTDVPGTSQVEYGTGKNYGRWSDLDTSLVATHGVTIKNLTPGTVYSFRVRSRNEEGHESFSRPYTVTTIQR